MSSACNERARSRRAAAPGDDTLNRQLERLNAELQQRCAEVEELQSRLAVEAMHDPLTQLFNRRYLDAMMPGLIANAARRGAPLALALIDLDHFKQVNDRYGHPAGDLVLKHIGRLFDVAAPVGCVLSLWRRGVLCRAAGHRRCECAKGARRACLQAARADDRLGWPKLEGFTFSAGVAVYPAHGQTVADLVASADRALYEAKGSGRNRVLMAAPLPAADRGTRARVPRREAAQAHAAGVLKSCFH